MRNFRLKAEATHKAEVRHLLGGFLAAAVSLITLAAALNAQPVPHEVALQAAIRTETVTGDLKSAIAQYREVISKYAAHRATVAMALVRMAGCHEKLGQAEAKALYQRVLNQYADQRFAADIARARLGSPVVAAKGIVNRQVWTGSDVDPLGTVSADGRYLSFVAWDTGDLAIRDIATGSVRRLTNKGTWNDSQDFAEESTISRDGTRVAYSWWNEKKNRYDLRVVRLDTTQPNAPKILYDDPDTGWLGPYDWSVDGRLLAVQIQRKDRTTQIGVVDTESGSFKPIKSVDWRGASRMFFSPDGSLLAYDLPHPDNGRLRDVFMLSVDGSRELKVADHPAHDVVVGWSPDGRSLLFASDRAGSLGLWSVEVHDGRVAGRPTLIKPDFSQLVSSLGITRAGALLYAIRTSATTIAIATIDFQTGKLLSEPVQPFESYLTAIRASDWSADGKRLVFISGRSMGGPAADMTIASVEDRTSREIRTRMNYVQRPRWAPDGSITVQGVDQNGRQGIYRIDPQSGDATPIVVSDPEGGAVLPCWLPDGKRFVYRKTQMGGRAAIVVRRVDTGDERTVVEGTLIRLLALSPDGRLLAYAERVERATTLNVVSIDEGVLAPRELVRAPGLSGMLWTPDGRSLIFGKAEGEKTSAWAVPVAGGSPRALDPSFPAAVGSIRIHPDGRRVTYGTGTNAMEVWTLENFLPTNAARK